jgi:uncharacterized protein (DUF58 family)
VVEDLIRHEKAVDEKTSDEKTSDEKTSDEKTSDEKTSDEKTVEPISIRLVYSRLGPGEDCTQAYQGQLVRRGRYLLGPLVVSSRFPLGLLRCTLYFDLPDTLLVVPRQGRLTARWRHWEQQSAQGDRSVKHRMGTVEGDFHSLRPYRSGDKRHLIHWRTSARRGQLMVRQFERPQTHDLAVFLDLWRPAMPDASHQETLELAVSMAATIVADRCHQNGSRLLLVVSGAKPVILRGAASPALLNDALEALALAEPARTDGLKDLLDQGLAQMPMSAHVVMISTRPSRTNDPGLAAAAVDNRQRAQLERMLVIDASGREIFDYFEP